MDVQAEANVGEVVDQSVTADQAAKREIFYECRSLLAMVSYWGERADTKAAILIAALTAAVASEVVLFPRLLPWVTEGTHPARYVVLVLAGGSLAMVLVALLIATFSVYPRLGPEYVYRGTLEPGDLLYFGRLKAIPPEAIATGLLKAIDSGSLIEDFADQLQVNARTAWTKHVQLRRSLTAFGAGVSLAAGAMVGWVVLTLVG